MSKPVLGLLLGAVLGFVDGASAYLYPYPDVKEQIIFIIIGSTFKGLITGIIAGWVATRLQSLPLGILVGLAIGLVLSWLVAWGGGDPNVPHYYLEIMLPGMALGAIVGFATQRYGRAPFAASRVS
jgi:hypothetical protein